MSSAFRNLQLLEALRDENTRGHHSIYYDVLLAALFELELLSPPPGHAVVRSRGADVLPTFS
eukprot:scaffold2201_cov240-Pinguiococcus_pyrenoidosus.AAC.13